MKKHITLTVWCFLYIHVPSDLLLPERATSSSLQSEDWELNLEICDTINSSEEGCVFSVNIWEKSSVWSCTPQNPLNTLHRPKDAIRAIKKRIIGNKNFKEVMLTLTVSSASVCHCRSWIVFPLTCAGCTLGPGDLREELWQQISHPGDNTGFHRGGSGTRHHPE